MSEGQGDESKGLRRIATGAAVGLAAGIMGLVTPIILVLFATYSPGTLFSLGRTLFEVTSILALAGALMFAISLLIYRLGFAALIKFDPRFWVASILCLLGTLGVLLIVVAIAIAYSSSDAMSQCIQGAPTRALSCVRSAAPLAAYSGTLGFWLAWLGGLGIVVGLALAGRRYTQASLYGGTAAYALLLLGLVAPSLGVLFAIGSLEYPLLLASVLAIIAPALVLGGSRKSLGRD
jgi:hypothetical protein